MRVFRWLLRALIKYHQLSIKYPRLTVTCDRPLFRLRKLSIRHYFGMNFAIAESGVVQSFRRQESGCAKPARVRACCICGDPDHLRSACPFSQTGHLRL